MPNKYVNPYNDHKSSDNRGVKHGPGIPGQVGSKKGTFTMEVSRDSQKQKNNPPRKMN